MRSHFIHKAFFPVLVLLLVTQCQQKPETDSLEVPRSRIIVLTDMLNEADDSQTMVRLLIYANRFDIEGLIAVSSCHQYKGRNDTIPERNDVHPEEILKFIDAYEAVKENLFLHEDGWPSAEYLRSKVGRGPSGFGMSDVGEGKSTSGSELIIDALTNDDPRPLYICINAGANCLAQALYDLNRQYSGEDFNRVIRKLRVYDDAGQDDAGAWIASQFPAIHYQRSQSQVFSFMNNSGPVTWDSAFYPGMGQHMWVKENIQNNHGPLGELYPVRMKWKDPTTYSTIEGGGSSTWIGHANRGLYVPEEITWGGWGGRFDSVKQADITANQLRIWQLEDTEDKYKPFLMYPEAADHWTDPATGTEYKETGAAIFRWRRGYQNDFEARMDWCLKPFDEANHNPVASVNGNLSDDIILVSISAGSSVHLDASESTDPDDDRLSYRWYVYPEAGNYKGSVTLKNSEKERVKLMIPDDAAGTQIHVILEVCDDNEIVSLYDYRRIVFNVLE